MGDANGLGQYLVTVRLSLGFSSALAFYEHLSAKAHLEFNYSYYKRFENEEILPSVKVINSLAHLLPEDLSDELILRYCAACFPDKKRIFKSDRSQAGARPRTNKRRMVQNKGTRNPQKVLNEKEIRIISSEKSIYYLFLLVTMSEGQVRKKYLATLFSSSELKAAVEALSEAKLIYEEKDYIMASYSEYAFPEGNSQSILSLYKKLDTYDQERNDFFKLQKKFRSEIFRKVSSRYTDLITEHLQMLLKLIRMADEADPKANDQILAFSFNLSMGGSSDDNRK